MRNFLFSAGYAVHRHRTTDSCIRMAHMALSLILREASSYVVVEVLVGGVILPVCLKYLA